MMQKKQLNKKYYNKNIFLPLKELFHLLFILLIKIFVNIACILIWFFTYESNIDGILTVRKAKRIRALTNFKLWFYRNFKGISHFFRIDKYFESIHRRFEI